MLVLGSARAKPKLPSEDKVTPFPAENASAAWRIVALTDMHTRWNNAINVQTAAATAGSKLTAHANDAVTTNFVPYNTVHVPRSVLPTRPGPRALLSPRPSNNPRARSLCCTVSAALFGKLKGKRQFSRACGFLICSRGVSRHDVIMRRSASLPRKHVDVCSPDSWNQSET